MLKIFLEKLRVIGDIAAIGLLPLFVRRKPTRKTAVLIFKPDRLGDFIVIAPQIQAMVDRFGAGRVVLIVSDANQDAARLLFPHCERLIAPLYLPLRQWKKWLELMRAVAAIDADYALFMRHHMRFAHSKAMWRVARAREKIWVKKAAGHVISPASDNWLMNGHGLVIETHPAPRESVEIHVAQVMLAAVCGATAKPARISEPVFASPRPQNAPRAQAVLFPFSNSPLRDLPAPMTAAIAHHLAFVHGFDVVLCGIPSRAADLDQIAKLAAESAPQTPAKNVTVFIPPDFEAFYRTIVEARIVISTDTGSAHVAILHDLPFIGLLGGGQYGIFAPWSVSDRQRWISHPLPCYGCNWECKFERAHCVTDIPLASIYAAIDQVLLAPA